MNNYAKYFTPNIHRFKEVPSCILCSLLGEATRRIWVSKRQFEVLQENETEFWSIKMPKNKGKGGKNRRRGKNENEGLKRELVFKEDGQEYAQVHLKHICVVKQYV